MTTAWQRRHNHFTTVQLRATLQAVAVQGGTLWRDGVPDASAWRDRHAEHVSWSPEQGGVLLVSAWRRGAADAADLVLARVTLFAGPDSSAVRLVNTGAELHALVDEWLTSLGDA